MAVSILNGATTAGTPTAWAAIPEMSKYVIQCTGSPGSFDLSNDGANVMVIPPPSSGGPSIQSTNSGSDQNTVITGFPVAFIRFIPGITAGSARVTLTSVNI